MTKHKKNTKNFSGSYSDLRVGTIYQKIHYNFPVLTEKDEVVIIGKGTFFLVLESRPKEAVVLILSGYHCRKKVQIFTNIFPTKEIVLS